MQLQLLSLAPSVFWKRLKTILFVKDSTDLGQERLWIVELRFYICSITITTAVLQLRLCIGCHYFNSLDCFFLLLRLPWIAPECYNQLRDISLHSDRYSFGVMLWEMFSVGQRPWDDKDPAEVSHCSILIKLESILCKAVNSWKKYYPCRYWYWVSTLYSMPLPILLLKALTILILILYQYKPVNNRSETELKLFIILGEVDPSLGFAVLALYYTCESHYSIS